MKIRIHNYENNAARDIDYPGSLSLFLKVHYLSWGFYGVTKTAPNRYAITDTFTGELVEEIYKI